MRIGATMHLDYRRLLTMFLFLVLVSGGMAPVAQSRDESPEIVYPGQEPLIFNLRRGTAATDAVERWEKAHTEENIRRIAATGRKMFYTHFYKGYGFQAEKEEMDLTVKTAAWARKYGMTVGVYVQWGTIVWETFLREDPRAEDWVLKDRNGHPVRINYGHYYWRYLPDYRNKEYMEYYKEKILRYCVEKVKPKYIFLDNVAENPPVSWQPLHNSTWVEGFREYLRDKYSPDQLRNMLGYPYVDFVLPPHWEWINDKVVSDPIMQRWIDFRCQSLTDAISDVCRFIKKLDPSIAVGVNIHGISRGNRAITGIDPVAVCNGTGVDGWGGEIWVHSQLTPDDVLVSPIREYKACHTLKVAFTSGGRTPLGRAVNLAFSYRLKIPGTGYLGGPDRFGYLAGPRDGDEWYKYVDYYRDTEQVADVAVLRSYPSLAYNSYTTWASTIGFEQALIQAKVPFALIFDDDLRDLSRYKVLVLANTECLSDEQVELIREFVRRGGGLVATGSASLYNEWRRPRPNFGLGDVLGLTRDEARKTLSAYRISDSVSTWVGVEGLNRIMRTFGRGRAVYIPRVVPAYQGDTIQMKLPVNWPELVESVRWASNDNLSIRVRAPLTVVMNLYRKKGKGQLLLHLVNFRQDLLRDIPVELKVPAGRRVKAITVISTDRRETESLKFKMKKGSVSFRVPLLETYDLVVVQLG